MGNTVASGHISGIKFRSRGCPTDGNDTLPNGAYPINSVDRRGTSSGELGAGTTIDIHEDKA